MKVKNIYKAGLILLVFFVWNCKTTEKKPINQVETDPRKIPVNEDVVDQDQLRQHMKSLFIYLEKIIAKGDFVEWYASISSNYKAYLNDPVNMSKKSQSSDYLKNRNIVLKGPKDYFEYVVIPSRKGTQLEFLDCQLINNRHVKVFCFDKTDKLIYDFRFEEDMWKVDR